MARQAISGRPQWTAGAALGFQPGNSENFIRRSAGQERSAISYQHLTAPLARSLASMANSQIMRRLECGTALDSVSASGTSRGLMMTQSRQRSVLAGVLPTRNECGGRCSSFENRLASSPDQRWSRIRSDRDTRAGATRRQIAAMVLRETLLLVFTGLVVGIPLAIGASRMITNQLYGLKPDDPVTILIASLVMTSIAVWAGYLPARRASRVDPMAALRCE